MGLKDQFPTPYESLAAAGGLSVFISPFGVKTHPRAGGLGFDTLGVLQTYKQRRIAPVCELGVDDGQHEGIEDGGTERSNEDQPG